MTNFELANGLYLVTTICGHCREPFQGFAIQNYSPYCEACRVVLEWDREYQDWWTGVPTFWPYGERSAR